MTDHRGSRKHVLDWTSSPGFLTELNAILAPSGAVVAENDHFMPRGIDAPEEARLDTFGPAYLPTAVDWGRVRGWWLKHTAGANTPNWDLAATCTIAGRQGLVLVEAKANVPELSAAGKLLSDKASSRSRENHEQIGVAMAATRAALESQIPDIAISRDSHYQLSNRVAFAWRLASLGLPVVLVYLGFIGDSGIEDVGASFASDEDWRRCFTEHAERVFPAAACERPIDCGAAPFWFLVRSREVLGISSSRGGRLETLA